MDETLTRSTGGSVSQADLTIAGHPPGMITGLPPFSVSAKKMAIWLFIIADAATFAACLVAYGFLRNGAANWPRPFHSIVNVAIMTFILLTSSLTMLLGVRAAKAANTSGAFFWTMITAGAGILFALLHIREWLGLIGEGMKMFSNPWGDPLFGASFFSITGLHLLHVTGGVIALLVVGLRYRRGRYNAADLEVTGLYWHFVDLVWMFVVPFVYLLNVGQ
jgi:cytochrome c oxidase subunit III